MRDAVLDVRFADHTLPAPSTATPVGVCPTPTCVTKPPLLRSLETELPSEFAIQTSPSAVTATPRSPLGPPVANVPTSAPAGETFCTLLLVQLLCQRNPAGSMP